MEDMLQMRRHEKDFIIRRQEKFYQMWEQSILVFMKNVETSSLSSVDRIVIKLSMPIYVDSFRQIRELTRDHVLDGHAADKISEKILQSITSSFGDMSYRANASIHANSSRVRNDFVFLLGLTLLIAALVAVISGFIGSALRNNLLGLTSSMIKLAKGDVHTRISAPAFKNEIGMMANTLRVFRDTEKKKLWAEINLKKAQEHTESIIESLNESLFEIDMHGVIIRANQASEKLWRTTADKLVGQKLVDLFVPKTEEEQKTSEKLVQLLFTQTQLEAMKLTSSDQAVTFMENTKVPLLLIAEDGTVAQANSAAAITFGYVMADLKGAQLEILIPKMFRNDHHHYISKEFKQQNARLIADGRGLTAQHKDGYEIEMSIGLVPFTIGMQSHMLCVCIRKEDKLGPGTMAEPALQGLFNGFDIDPAVARFATGRGRGALCEDEIITANGSMISVDVSGGLFGNPLEGKSGAIVTVRDVSERKIAETAKAEFVATISHELRTPLTSIKGALGVMNSGVVGELNDKLSHLVSIALSNSDRLIGLVNDILDVEKISVGKMDFKFKPMDVCELVHSSIEANHGYAKTYGVAFKYKGIDKKIMVNGDKDRLMQVMSNLMSNAAKFSGKGQDIEISLKCENRKVRVQVEDNGSGIPEAAQATIFDKFTQADSSDKRQKGGTGLGLSIVKTMVEAHGGKIAFNSVEGKGTAFYFDLDLLA